jgi:tetratricopeptide (TPR) repeat protein
MMTGLCAVLLFAVACKKTDEKKAETPTPAETPKPAAPADVPVTTKTEKALEAFEIGREHQDAGRAAEAAQQFKKAIEIDPEFAHAYAYLGQLTPGLDGTAALDKAVSLTANLPEAEKQMIIAMQAVRAGDRAKAKAAYDRVIELAPGSSRAAWVRATLANAERDYAGAVRHFETVKRLEPSNTAVYNGLAYAHAGLRQWEQAIAAAKKQVELTPSEPNAHDTLGEVLMQARKFDEAETAFGAALAADPKFGIAWQGVGLARAYRGDYKGAQEAFDKRETTGDLFDTLQTKLDAAWVWFAEDKLKESLAEIDSLEKEPKAKESPLYAFASLDRGHILAQAGKHSDATKAYATTKTRGEAFEGARKSELMRGYRMGVLRLAALVGKPAVETDTLLAAANAEAKALGDSVPSRSHVAYLEGLVAWAANDIAAAVAAMSKCLPELSLCRFDLAALQRKLGDSAGAQATEKLLRETPTRDPATVYTISHLPKQ